MFVRYPHLATFLQSEQNAVLLRVQLSPPALLLISLFYWVGHQMGSFSVNFFFFLNI